VGGKIEPGESPMEAMVREFEEETGVYLIGWQELGILEGPSYILHFFWAGNDHVLNVQTVTDEEVRVFPITELPDRLMNNVRWMIPFILDGDVQSFGHLYMTRG
jgi:8-oxo-dGTP diphosphatase